MEELRKLQILDCIKNVKYDLKVTKETFDRANTDVRFATQLLEYCQKKECFELDGPMLEYDQDEAETFSETPSTSFEMSQMNSAAEKSVKKSRASKSLAKGKNVNKSSNENSNKSIEIKNWSRNEVLLLIAAYKEYQLEFLDINIPNGDVWAKIAETINESQELPPIAAEKCKTKWETLKRRYKSLKDSQKNSGSAPITWAFYDEMEEVFGEQPWVKPLSTAGSNITNKMDPDIISPPRKKQKTLTNFCEELLAAKKENSEIRQRNHRKKIACISELSGALNKLVDHLTK